VRFDGRALPSPAATVAGLWTWIERLGILLFCTVLVASIVGRHSRRGTSVTDALRPWRRVAAWMLVVAACLARPARAQEATKPLPSTIAAPYESALDAAALPLLPSGDSVFTLIETMNVETISDRVSTGGLGFGSAPRLSA